MCWVCVCCGGFICVLVYSLVVLVLIRVGVLGM